MDRRAEIARTNAILISSGYLFLPMLIGVEEPEKPIRPPQSVVAQEQSIFEDILGQGGPENESKSPERRYLEMLFGEEYASSMLPEEREAITVTKTYNYMKVANTTWPVDTPEVSSDYGWRTPPCDACSADHRGIDFVPGFGTPVYAVTDGMIVNMGWSDGYGNYAILEHLVPNVEGEVDEWTTIYAHMKNDSFVEGLKVGSVLRTGDQIGEVGSTGVSTGPHLHFELLINGEHVDPMPLLGTYEVVVVEESEQEDWLYLGDTFRSVTKTTTYE